MKIDPLILIDGYKIDHRRQYPSGTTLVFSNFTPRKSRLSGIDYVIFFGLQYFIKRYLIEIWEENFFHVPEEEIVRRYKRRIDNYIGPNNITMDHIIALHRLKYIPIKILALPEGVKVPIKVPPFVMYNTHDDFSWLVNYLETILSCSLWQACTSATIANEFRVQFNHFAKATGADMNVVDFQGHDFSFRGMSSLETAMLSGAGHLLSFKGTDTIPAIDFLEQYYNADCEKELIGASVPATEHSVMCMGGKESEIETFRRLFSIYPSGILSIVSDTWDYWKIIRETTIILKKEILERQGKIVFRPDSCKKTPYEIIVGDPEGETEWERKGSIEVLWDIFGGMYNNQGFKELDSHVGLIYGDSITLELAKKINEGLLRKGFASTNWVAGIGSFSYQFNTRDTQGWAMKATYGEVKKYDNDHDNGAFKIECREIFKDPKTDDGMKKSAKGLIAVHKDAHGYYLKDQTTWFDVHNCEYKLVFSNSMIIVDHTLSEIRERVKIA